MAVSVEGSEFDCFERRPSLQVEGLYIPFPRDLNQCVVVVEEVFARPGDKGEFGRDGPARELCVGGLDGKVVRTGGDVREEAFSSSFVRGKRSCGMSLVCGHPV